MDYTERLSDLTLEQAHLQQRQAALLTALAENVIGGVRARYDPSALDGFFLNRGANSAVKMQVKAAIAAGTIADGTWGGPLAPGRPLLAAHLAAADRRATLPRLGAPRVPATNVVGAAQTAGAVGYWVGESGPKPLSALGYAAFSLTPRKIAADVAATEEWATWLLFFLESHGAEVTLHEDRSVRVNLDPIPGLDASTVDRWAPVVVNLLPEFRQILLARLAASE